MKRIYFVRHGESVANVDDRVQGLADPLTDTGERQAQVVASRMQNLKIDALIASDAVRAQSTAAAIALATGHTVETSPLFREVKPPSSLEGLMRTDERYMAYLMEKNAHRGEETWHFEDEENFIDRTARADAAIAYLLAKEGEDIAVVTHGHFLRLLMTKMIMREKMTEEIWDAFATGFMITNTAITIAVYTDDVWRILSWNDHAHFAE